MTSSKQSKNKLDELCQALQKCESCPYNNYVWNEYCPSLGYGKFGCHVYSKKAKVMIVGQNPSHKRRPFPLNHSLSGIQGDIFREIFGKNNLILTNLIQTSSPDNRVRINDVHHGFYHLKREIDYYRPEMIIALGSFARQALQNTDNVVFLRHPNYYLTYHRKDWPKYVEAVKKVHEAYLQYSKSMV